MIRTNHDYKLLEIYNCQSRADSANKRFKDNISKWDILDVLQRYEFKCFYCQDSIKNKKWQLDHFYPRSMGGLNSHENLVCTCNWCNTMKNALDGFSFIHKCKNIYENNMLYNLKIDFNTHNKKEKSFYKKRFRMAKKELLKDENIDVFTENQKKIIIKLLKISSGFDDC